METAVTVTAQSKDVRLAGKVNRLLGETLVADGAITSAQLEQALREANARKELLGQALVRLGAVSEDQILFALARQSGVEAVDLDTTPINVELTRSFPEQLLRAHRVVPIRRDGPTLTAATCDIGNLEAVDALRRHSNLFVTLVAARQEQIIRQLDRIFGKGQPQAAAPVVEPPPAPRTTGEAAPADDRSAAMIVEQLLRKAVKAGASDIHIEPEETAIATRFRHDGMLRPGPSLPRALYSGVLTRIKILANLNIAENRLPQDGRILHQVGDHRLDLRVSVFPTIHGEKVAIRVLDKSRSFGLEMLGMSPAELTAFRKCITRPHGLFLVTGPTGSGKTTTLYSALAEINSVERNIVTLEDPVEYELPGIRQTQVNPRAGLTFVVGLRALLRQDPDVMLVGEMRDLETVEIAIRAAMTGHLVFSTLHTNDALGAIPRLLDMGVPRYLIASSLVGVLAQRLVRVICTECRTAVSPAEAGVERLGDIGRHLTTAYVGKGCAACNRTGYRGRLGVFELAGPEVLALAGTESNLDVVKQMAIERKLMIPMIVHAVQKVEAGVTTVDEVLRTVFAGGAA